MSVQTAGLVFVEKYAGESWRTCFRLGIACAGHGHRLAKLRVSSLEAGSLSDDDVTFTPHAARANRCLVIGAALPRNTLSLYGSRLRGANWLFIERSLGKPPQRVDRRRRSARRWKTAASPAADS